MRENKRIKMVHLCFVCETPFHLLNCINYSYHVREDVSVDLYVRQEDYLNEDMIDRVRNEGLFENVYSYSYEKDRFHSFSGKRYRFYDILFPGMMLKKLLRSSVDIGKKHYNYIYCAVPTDFVRMLLMLQKEAVVRYYDDGVGSYTDNIEASVTRKQLLLSRLLHRTYPNLTPQYIYLNNVEMCEPGAQKKAKRLPSIAEASTELKGIIGRVFSYQEDDLYENHRIVYLTQPNDSESDDYEKVNQEIERVLAEYKEQCLVRVHPRQMGDYSSGLFIDTSNNMWELVCPRHIRGDHVLISACSTAQVTPKMFFGREPWLVFTYKLYGDFFSQKNITTIETMISLIKESYHDPEKIIIPENHQEFEMELKKII